MIVDYFNGDTETKDPYVTLAGHIVWRAVQDAFCGRKYSKRYTICAGRNGCEQCREEAFCWLTGNEGKELIAVAGLNSNVIIPAIKKKWESGMYLERRRDNAEWKHREDGEV